MNINRAFHGMFRLGLSAAVAISISTLSGCGGKSGPQRSSVKGKVTFDGQPVADGSIVFLPAQGVTGPSAGGEIRDGVYDIAEAGGPVPGAHRVEITATRTEGTENVAGVDGATGGASGGGSIPKVTMYIPPQYNLDSTLQADIKSGANTFDFELKSSR